MPSFDVKDRSRHATFTRRTALLSVGMASVFGLLAVRLHKLQIVDGDFYLTRAEKNRISVRLLVPPRGWIFDRFGVTLAGNRRNYRVLIVPEQTPAGFEAMLDTLGGVFSLPERMRARALREAAANPPFAPIVVAENLSWDDFARLNLGLPYLQGVHPDVGETRDYPFGEELSHVLGYVAQVAPEDKTGADRPDDPLLDLPGFRIGKRGVEQALDGHIRGHAGTSQVEVNAYGRVIRELARDDGRPGNDVYLTVDRELQHFVHERLNGVSAAAVVMDVHSGDVLALVSTPGFDPNAFNTGLTTGQWNALTEDMYKPLLNKAVSGVYPPGSTFKAVTALAALELGAITPDFSVVCRGKVTLGGHDFHCWRRGGHGRVDLYRGLKQSCDSFFYEVARRLGIDGLHEGALRLGLGQPMGIELPGERSGLVPDRNWKYANFGEPWQLGETLIVGIGQGYLLMTPLQLCTLAARIASGRNVQPRIIHTREGERRPEPQALEFSQETLSTVRHALNGVVNEPDGTAFGSRIREAGMEMAGKTGTAQVRRITMAERATGVRANSELPWKLRDHSLFFAYAPVAAPRYACAVVVEHGANSLVTAAPATRDILLFAQQRDPLIQRTAYPVAAAAPASAPVRQRL